MVIQGVAWDCNHLLRGLEGISKSRETIYHLMIEMAKHSIKCWTVIFEGINGRWSNHLQGRFKELQGFPWQAEQPGGTCKVAAVAALACVSSPRALRRPVGRLHKQAAMQPFIFRLAADHTALMPSAPCRVLHQTIADHLGHVTNMIAGCAGLRVPTSQPQSLPLPAVTAELAVGQSRRLHLPGI